MPVLTPSDLKGIPFGTIACKEKRFEMKREKKIQTNFYGDETPSVKDFLMIIAVAMLLIALDWIAYYKLGWFH